MSSYTTFERQCIVDTINPEIPTVKNYIMQTTGTKGNKQTTGEPNTQSQAVDTLTNKTEQ